MKFTCSPNGSLIIHQLSSKNFSLLLDRENEQKMKETRGALK